MRIFVLCSVLFLTSLSLSACSNTLDGAGRDMEKAGRSIQETF